MRGQNHSVAIREGKEGAFDGFRPLGDMEVMELLQVDGGKKNRLHPVLEADAWACDHQNRLCGDPCDLVISRGGLLRLDGPLEPGGIGNIQGILLRVSAAKDIPPTVHRSQIGVMSELAGHLLQEP